MRIVRVTVPLAARTEDTCELEGIVVRKADNVPVAVANLCQLPAESKGQVSDSVGRVGDGDATGRVVDEARALDTAVPRCFYESAAIVIGEIVVRSVGKLDRRECVHALRLRACI